MQVPTKEQFAAGHELAEALVRFLAALRVEPPKPAEQPPCPQVEPPPVDDLPPDKLLVSTREAASLLSISDRTLWKLTTPRGPIPAVRLKHSVRYSVAALRAWIRSAQRQ